MTMPQRRARYRRLVGELFVLLASAVLGPEDP
jgi:hypothetical protein